MSPSQFELQLEEERKKQEERGKIEFTQAERLLSLQAALEIPKIMHSAPEELRLYYSIQKHKFLGPDPPNHTLVALLAAAAAQGVQVPAQLAGGVGSENASSVDAYDSLSPADQAQIVKEEGLITAFTEGLRASID